MNKQSMSRRLWSDVAWHSLILMVGLISSVAYGQRGGGPPTKVKVMQAKLSEIEVGAEALASTRAMDSLSITSTVSETIASFHFEEGQFLKQGDLIVVFTKAEEEAQKDAIEAQLAEHRREVKRLQRLVEKGAAAQSQLDARLTNQAQAEAALREINAKISDRTIRAPFDGVVGIRRYSVGALVRPGDEITTLDAIQTMKVEMSVPATYIPKLKVGQEFRASSDVFGERIFTGKLTHIGTRIDEVTRALAVRGELPNPDLVLKPGLFMNVTITTEKRRGIMIPEIAVIFRGDQQYLYLVDEAQTVQRRPVQLGTRSQGRVEIRQGLQVGESVLIEGVVKVSPGQKVEVIRSPAASKDRDS